MGLKRIGKGHFRGPTQPKIFQTVDIGSGTAERIQQMARKNPRRNYAIVDPEYRDGNFGPIFREGQRIKRAFQNVRVAPSEYANFIDEMKRNGWRARHVNVDMPDLEMSFWRILKEAPNILLPNGKIFVTTEDTGVIKKVWEDAERFGLKVRQLRPFPQAHSKRLTAHMKQFKKQEFFRLEITFGLKKAFPEKGKRRKWPEQ